jgi:hypothetical protein
MTAPHSPSWFGRAALVTSLVLAFASLTYTAWRNEVTESQRTARQAGFETLRALGELQAAADAHRYTASADSLITGWSRVLEIRELGRLYPASTACRRGLFAVWERAAATLETQTRSEKAVAAAVAACREETVAMLVGLK